MIRRESRGWRASIFAPLCCLVVCGPFAVSQEPQPVESVEVSSAEHSSPDVENRDPVDHARRNRIATASVLLFSAVLVLSVGLLGIVLLLGARARRLAREPLRDCQPLDEYWFLRKRLETEPNQAAAADENGADDAPRKTP